MRTSEKLYNLNAYISLNYVGLETPVTLEDITKINEQLGVIIKEIRELEE